MRFRRGRRSFSRGRRGGRVRVRRMRGRGRSFGAPRIGYRM